jgi:ABC-2 type transport system permease protein
MLPHGAERQIHLVWYYIVIESILVAQSGLASLFDASFIQGNFAYNIVRPVSYRDVILINEMTTSLANYLLNLMVGLLLGIILTRQIPFLHFNYIIIFLMGGIGVALDTAIRIIIKLLSFWLKKPFIMILAYQKMSFVLGGIFFPLSYYPDWLKMVSNLLPFKLIFYFPANAFYYGKIFDWGIYLLELGFWCIIIGVTIRLLYARGLRKISIEGI